MNPIDFIRQEMNNGNESTDRQSEDLVKTYNAADQSAKKAIDDALICICGRSLLSILVMLSVKKCKSY